MVPQGSLYVFLAAMLFFLVEAKDKEQLQPCRNVHHACTTLMKYPDGLVVDEGPYCRCEGSVCGDEKSWVEDDGKSLTWRHHERAHWLIQYRFCVKLMPEVSCGRDERAALVETEIKAWHPELAQPRCRCPGNIYQLSGWKKDASFWRYEYKCEKPTCDQVPDESDQEKPLCARINIDSSRKSGEKVKEITFYCSCPQGEMCPSKLRDRENDDKDEILTDGQGEYVLKRCESIKPKDKRRTQS